MQKLHQIRLTHGALYPTWTIFISFTLDPHLFLVGLTESILMETQTFRWQTLPAACQVCSSLPQSKIVRPLPLKAVSRGCPSSFWFLLENSFPEALSHVPPLSLCPTYKPSGGLCSRLQGRRNQVSLQRHPASSLRVRRLSKHFDFKGKRIRQSIRSQFPQISLPFLTTLQFTLLIKPVLVFIPYLKFKWLIEADIVNYFSYFYSL